MDIVYIVVTLAGAILLTRARALTLAVAAWAVCVAFVAWGPAHNSEVHVGSAGFWIPWALVLLVGVIIVFGVAALRSRRHARRRVEQPLAG